MKINKARNRTVGLQCESQEQQSTLRIWSNKRKGYTFHTLKQGKLYAVNKSLLIFLKKEEIN